ncbi:MAG: hypothetical protein QM755_03910 [Luteolibacter sp.]
MVKPLRRILKIIGLSLLLGLLLAVVFQARIIYIPHPHQPDAVTKCAPGTVKLVEIPGGRHNNLPEFAPMKIGEALREAGGVP